VGIKNQIIAMKRRLKKMLQRRMMRIYRVISRIGL
jgi:hypothetical protein